MDLLPKDEDVCASRVVFEVLRLRVAHGDGGVPLQEQQRHRLADDIAAADHYRVPAGNRNFFLFEQVNDAGRGAGDESPGTQQQCARTVDMEAINVLCRSNRLEDTRFIQMRGQRQLHKHSVNARIRV